ncbi:hypothetical protein EYF80_056556 [Liparis tanakae]|uniref:Uncharacterized protein n=1 Tax=Liparis tanakae TaxID=230148 RepID=A0A4Z2EWN2_9TELE|nr:hypothetical protein EYF80_056556 [Liparis tanakae]
MHPPACHVSRGASRAASGRRRVGTAAAEPPLRVVQQLVQNLLPLHKPIGVIVCPKARPVENHCPDQWRTTTQTSREPLPRSVENHYPDQ